MSKTTKQKQGNQQGSCYALKDGTGRYRWAVTVGWSDDGKQQRLTGIAANKTEAKRALTSAIADRDRGLLTSTDRVRVGEWLQRWLDTKRHQVATTTFEQYEMYLRLYVPAQLRDMRLREVKPSHLRDLDSEMLSREKPLASATRSKVFSHLRAAFEMAVEEGLIHSNPARAVRVKATSQEQQTKRRKAMNDDELARFFKQAQGHPQYALFYMLFSLGLRRGEGLGLQWQDIDLDAGTVNVARQVKLENNRPVVGTLKTAGSQRRLYMADDLVALLRQHRTAEEKKAELLGIPVRSDSHVFTSAAATVIHPRNVNRELKKLCDAAGIPAFSSHSGRHTNITHRLKAGQAAEVVAAIAGHRDINTTLSHYRAVMEEEKRAATFSLGSRLAEERPAQLKQGHESGASIRPSP